MKVFKIKEIDHEKFREENKWAIKPRPREWSFYQIYLNESSPHPQDAWS
jgi:hypothetical protein